VPVNAVGGATLCTPTCGFDFYPALSIVDNSSHGFYTDFIDACRAGTVSPCDAMNAIFSIDDLGDYFSGEGSIFVIGDVSGRDLSATGTIFGEGGISLGRGSVAPGNVDITGQYQKNGTCVTGCAAATATSTGRAVVSYSAQETVSTIEDFGEAQLANGQAYVRLGADFANVIDQKPNYLVFITPEGDNRGVYVSNKTRTGFAVHEGQGGRSNFMFSYRIVAKRYGESAARLPAVTLEPKDRFTPHSQRSGASGFR
jgi:hypothetical protein